MSATANDLTASLKALAARVKGKRSGLYSEEARVAIARERKALLEGAGRSVGQNWGYDVCRACKLHGKSFSECRAEQRNHSGPDAGATLEAGLRVRWRATERSEAVEGVIVSYTASTQLHLVDAEGGAREAVSLATIRLQAGGGSCCQAATRA